MTTLFDSAPSINAGVASALSREGPFSLPQGAFNISSPILLGDNKGSDLSGLTIKGAGRGSTTLVGATTLPALIATQPNNPWFDLNISDLGFQGGQYGVLFQNTMGTAAILERLKFQGPMGICAGLQVTTGQNGEFVVLRDCWAFLVNGVIKSAAGQAYCWSVDNFQAQLNPGSDWFVLDCSPDGDGGGLTLSQFSGSAIRAPNAPGATAYVPTNSLFLRVKGLNYTPILITGGRNEHVTRLLDLNYGGRDPVGFIYSVKGVEITTDNNGTGNPWIWLSGMGVPTGTITFEDCVFSAASLINGAKDPTQCLTGAVVKGSWGRMQVIFIRCSFNGYGKISMSGEINKGTIGMTPTPAYYDNTCRRDGAPFVEG